MSETVTIDRLGHEGDGIAETASGPLYVPFTLPGERVRIEAEGDGATLLEVLEVSPDRVPAPCRHFGTCGGCALQHMAAPAYAAWKTAQVAAAFAQRGIEAPVAPTTPVAPRTRRRVVFAVARSEAGTRLGFNRRASHDIVAITECVIAAPAIVARRAALARLADTLLQRGERGRLSVVAGSNGLDVALARDGRRRALTRQQITALAAFAADPAIARISVDGETALAVREPEIAAGGLSLFPVAGGFLQAAAEAEDALAAAVLAGLDRPKRIADLFAGIGTFTLRLARQAPVLAVDGDAAAVAALEKSVRRASGIKAVTAQKRDLFRMPMTAMELRGIDTVVFDPPRAGAAAQAAELARSQVATVIAVSCNPATLARDARTLLDGGYRLRSVQPVDQFLWTPHVEAVAVFSR